MKLLALETSTNACSAALRCGDRIFEQHAVEPREHTRLLIPMVRKVLAESGVAAGNLDAVILGNGPGSFIGMRIAASVAQGLAFAAGVKIVPVSSLAAVAAEAFHENAVDNIIVAQDAHMQEVYLARFKRGERGLAVADGVPILQPIGRIDLPKDGSSLPWHAAGAGWQRYPELWQLNADRFAGVVESSLPRARFLLEMGAAGLARGEAVEPDQIVPDYLRSQVAAVPGSKSA